MTTIICAPKPPVDVPARSWLGNLPAVAASTEGLGTRRVFSPFVAKPSLFKRRSDKSSMSPSESYDHDRKVFPFPRFWKQVDQSGGPDACHPWTGELDLDGYGRSEIKLCATDRAHRIALIIFLTSSAP
jgi:hypothetical protein